MVNRTLETRPVPGYEGHYSITSDGRVWSHKSKGGWLVPVLSRLGYLGFSLCKQGVQRRFMAHRLVALAWVPNGNPAANIVINHIDGNKINNAASNLEWCTHSHNCRHAFETGLRSATPRMLAHSTGMGKANRRLSDEAVRSIRSRVSAGEKQIDLAREFGVSRGNMSQLVSRRIYRDII